MFFFPIIARLFYPSKVAGSEAKPQLQGMRFQLYKALKQMREGRSMLVVYRIPDLNIHMDDPVAREAFFKKLKPVDIWKSETDFSKLEAVAVPGTWYSHTVGQMMMKQQWCEPAPDPHWIPNARLYSLTKEGLDAFERAGLWWNSLSLGQKLSAAFVE